MKDLKQYWQGLDFIEKTILTWASLGVTIAIYVIVQILFCNIS